MKYTRKDGDKGYRYVSLTVTAIPQFTMFTQPEQVIVLDSDQDCKSVIEIQREDGSTFLVEPEMRYVEYYTVLAADKIYVRSKMPYARLWVRHIDRPFPCYKVPTKLLEDPEKGRATILFYNGAQNVELFGDRYFQAIYDLQRS